MAMSASIKISTDGAALTGRQLKDVRQEVERLGAAGRLSTSSLTRGFSGALAMVKEYKGLITGIALAGGAKKLMEFDDHLANLQRLLKETRGGMMKYRDAILEVQSKTGVHKNELVEGLEKAHAQGVLEQTTEKLQELAIAARASGEDFGTMANMFGVAVKRIGLRPDAAMKWLEELIAKGEAAGVNMTKLQRAMPMIAVAGGARNMTPEAMTRLAIAASKVPTMRGGGAGMGGMIGRQFIEDIVKHEPRLRHLVGQPILDKDKHLLMDPLEIARLAILRTGGSLRQGARGAGGIFSGPAELLFQSLIKQVDFKTKQWKTGSIIATADKESGADYFKTEYARLMGGISSESEKLKRSMMYLDEIFQKLGKTVLGIVGEHPYASGGALVGGKLISDAIGAAIGAAIMKKMFGGAVAKGGEAVTGGVLSSAMGGLTASWAASIASVGLITTIATVVIPLAVMAAADYFLMKYDVGGKIGKFAAGYDPTGGEAMAWAGKNNALEAARGTAKKQLNRLLDMSAAGKTSFELTPGHRVALTAANALTAVQKVLERQGGGKLTPELAAILKELGAHLKDFPDSIVVNHPALSKSSIAVKRKANTGHAR
jgi:hypothetical protein